MPIPIVKSGPNKGKERSRNKNGQWRRKRRDTGYRRKFSEDVLAFLDYLKLLEEGKVSYDSKPNPINDDDEIF